MIRPITTEKAVRMIETDNVLLFEIDRRENKTKVKKEFEKMFNAKVIGVRTFIRQNKKFAYIRLDKKKNLAIDIATKLGMI